MHEGPRIQLESEGHKGCETYKPNSVQRCRCDSHSSRPAIAGRLKRPTRKFGAPSRHTQGLFFKGSATACACFALASGLSDPARAFPLTRPCSFPIWSCSVWGLPCPVHYCPGGALLPHLFTLTPGRNQRRYVFCGTFRPLGLNPTSRTLSGTLLCGVRTFLSLAGATVRSGCHYNTRLLLEALDAACAIVSSPR